MKAPAIISPFDYVSMVWALVIGLVIFDSFPTVPALIGTAIVIAAGAFILYRETVRGHDKERIKPGP
jgi:drug/metabolite transporter (DMT)-like permease